MNYNFLAFWGRFGGTFGGAELPSEISEINVLLGVLTFTPRGILILNLELLK
jgi:hypothetical protein